MRRWFGASGRRVPPIAVEGEHDLPLDEALVLDDVGDTAALREAFERRAAGGRPRRQRRGGGRGPRPAGGLVRARPARSKRELLDLDLVELTYGA